jgi:class 3 adenylate cyclase
MADSKLLPEIQIISDLDRIRDETLDMESMCRQFADYLKDRLGLLEIHILVRNRESQALENPAPDRPITSAAQEFLNKAEKDGLNQPTIEGPLAVYPMQIRGNSLGALLIRRTEEIDAEMARLTDIALSIVDSSIEHALSYSDLREKNTELSAVFELDHIRDQHLGFDEMIDRVAQKLIDFIPSDGSSVVLFEKNSDLVDIRFPSNKDLSSFEDPACLKSIKELAHRSFELRGLVSAERVHDVIGSALCIPLILGEDILGAFLVMRKHRDSFTSFERRLLTAMASQIDTAIFESLQRQKIKSVFKRYVSKPVVDEMLRTGTDFLEGQRRVLTVLFSDLRGFTATSERLDTDLVVEMLNEHLSAMTEIVLANRGTLDKFIGDCVMAFWGAPVDQPEHAWLAVKAAIEMRAAHEKLAETWKARGLDPIYIGIGVNTGEMFVGNIGSDMKSSYTVIGDHVNLTSRLEGVALGRQILITERTLDSIRDKVKVETLEPVKVKGKQDPIPIFNVVDLA